MNGLRLATRAEAGAERSPIEIVDLGLKHLDPLSAATLEKQEARLKQWTSKWIPLLSTSVALMALLTSTYLQRQASADQRVLKEYEVDFRPKVDGYTRVMQSLSTAFERAEAFHDPRLPGALSEVELSAIQSEPFLKTSERDRFKDKVQNFIRFCLEVRQTNQLGQKTADEQIEKL